MDWFICNNRLLTDRNTGDVSNFVSVPLIMKCLHKECHKISKFVIIESLHFARTRINNEENKKKKKLFELQLILII